MIRTLYLAGPDVFRPDARERGLQLKAACARFGFEGLFPLDQDVPAGLGDPAAQAAWIYRANIGLIERADAVLANLDFFRGPEPDSGTCFEVGYAVARGKPVFGYIPEHGSFAERIRRRHPQAIGPDGVLDVHGWSIEEFGLPLNLMLSVPAPLVVGDRRTQLGDPDAGGVLVRPRHDRLLRGPQQPVRPGGVREALPEVDRPGPDGQRRHRAEDRRGHPVQPSRQHALDPSWCG